MRREWQLENGAICSLSKHPGEPVQSSGTLWSFLALLCFRHSAPPWRSGMKLHNVRIAVNGFYSFSCCAALARLTLLSCELCPMIRHWLNSQSFYILLHLYGNTGNIISVAHFAIRAAKKKTFTWVPLPCFENHDKLAFLGPPQPLKLLPLVYSLCLQGRVAQLVAACTPSSSKIGCHPRGSRWGSPQSRTDIPKPAERSSSQC